VILIPGVDPTTDGRTGNLAALVEHPLTRTLTGEISANVITASGISFSPAVKPLCKHEVNKILKAHALAKSVARSLSLAVNPEATADLSEMAVRIAVAHPRNVLKHVGPLEVPTVQLQAIVAALLLEAGKGDISEPEAGDYLLNCVHELQAVVPRYQWHFLPPVPVYFAEFEYRRDPTTFLRARAGASNGKRRGTEGNADALREFLAGQRDGDGCDSELAADAVRGVREGDDTGDVPALHGSPERVGQGGDHQGLHERVGGMPVLAKPSYPPRVQWPRRVR
jgi:hypothetical protein